MRTINKLSAAEVRSKGPGRYGDGGNLYLVVTEAGTRQWIFRYRWEGKEKELGLGAAGPGRVSLPGARAAAQANRDILAAGKDPQAVKAEARQKTDKQRTFAQASDEYLKAMRKGWKNKKHAKQWEYSLKVLAAPLRPKLVHLIDVPDVLAVIRPHWERVPETGRRLRGRIENVLSYATSHKYRSGPNPAAWKDNLKGLLPKSQRGTRGHHPALPYEKMREFMTDLRQRQAENDTLAAYALELTILTVTRTSEMLLARYPEFDLSKALWTVPGERMKMGKEHRIPLSPRAVEIVKVLMSTRWGDYLFPGNEINKHLSNMSMLMLLRRMGYEEITVHGFRSTFRDWAGETTSFPGDVCEHVLAHKIEDESEAAYRRGTMLKKRTEVMKAWANYIEPKTSSNVIPLSQEAKR
ncbi:MAG: tyrosine-type recombinase/integrase [Pseudomonadota bacterium]